MVKVNFGGLELKNPVMPASGTFGYGKEFTEFFDLSLMGAVVCKTVTLKKREGNRPPRIADNSCSMLNSIGLENKGVEEFIETALPFLANYDTKIVASIAGNSAQEYGELAKILDKQKVDAIEVNLSCPNVVHGHNKGLFAQDAYASGEIIAAVRKNASKPIFAKLTAQVSFIVPVAQACQKAGAHALTLINTIPAMAVSIKTKRPLLGNVCGGLSGGAIKPIALKAVWDVFNKVKIPLIGAGGIMTTEDALEFILCGASAVQVGSANFVNPFACKEITEGLNKYFKDKNISDLRGKLQI